MYITHVLKWWSHVYVEQRTTSTSPYLVSPLDSREQVPSNLQYTTHYWPPSLYTGWRKRVHPTHTTTFLEPTDKLYSSLSLYQFTLLVGCVQDTAARAPGPKQVSGNSDPLLRNSETKYTVQQFKIERYNESRSYPAFQFNDFIPGSIERLFDASCDHSMYSALN